jgi:hypothetical protein
MEPRGNLHHVPTVVQMDVQGFSREIVANATAASGLDIHYAKECGILDPGGIILPG